MINIYNTDYWNACFALKPGMLLALRAPTVGRKENAMHLARMSLTDTINISCRNWINELLFKIIRQHLSLLACIWTHWTGETANFVSLPLKKLSNYYCFNWIEIECAPKYRVIFQLLKVQSLLFLRLAQSLGDNIDSSFLFLNLWVIFEFTGNVILSMSTARKARVKRSWVDKNGL